MKRVLLITIVLAVATLGLSLPAGGDQPATIKLAKYDVALVDLDEPYVVTLANGEKTTYRQAYLIRLHGDFPTRGARLMELYFGDERIGEYGGFPGGIYFMVYTRERLNELAGREIRYRFGEGDIRSFGQTFEPNGFAPFAACPLRAALTKP